MRQRMWQAAKIQDGRALWWRTCRSEDEARAALAGLNPGGRLLTPDEVAAVLLRLCLPESASVTGQAIEIPGGDAQ